MMLKIFRRWQAASLDRQAAKWVMRIDEDRDENEAALRRWIGQDQTRADAYNRAFRALHGASASARAIYGDAGRRGIAFRVADPRAERQKLILVTASSLVLASVALYFVVVRLTAVAPRPLGESEVERDYSTHIGEVRPLRLADGSQLLLDTNTEVHVILSPASRRIVMVHGRVRFTVAHDPARPFSVLAGDATITDRGTVFDVEAYRDVRVRLIAGAIDVAFKKPIGGASVPPIHLIAGQQIRFDPTLTSLPPPPTVTPASDAQWVTGLKTFDDVPVGEILDEVNRYSSTRVVLADPALASHRVFLDLDIRDTSAVAQNLAGYLKLEVDASQPGELVLRAPVQPN